MITLISALIGFLSSAMPEFFSLIREGKDRRHELALLKLQMQHAQTQLQRAENVRLEEIQAHANSIEQLALNARVKPIGVAWVDALSASVRPMVTYLFFAVYVAIKLAQFHLLVQPALPWQSPVNAAQALVTIWGQEDMALFSAVVAFWFGQRTLSKFRYGPG